MLERAIDYLDLASAAGPRRERIARSPNFKGGVFANPVDTPVMVPGSTWSAAKDWLAKKNARPPRPLPAVKPSFAEPCADEVRLCWLGHSTVLVEIEGLRVLFDPVWAERSSPSQLAGPRRFQPSPLALDELPALSAVAISHDHYDHLDRDAIRTLAARDPRMPFIVPLGVGARLERWGVAPERLRELDWWDEVSVADARLRMVVAPARHFSGRGLLDRNRTLWASYALLGRKQRVYFGGDGGPSEAFAELGRRFGPFDATLLEIGAYNPSWGLIHLGPEGALRAHAELRGARLLPIHWGAYDLAVHEWDEPINTLCEGASTAGARLLLPRMGERVRLDAPPAPEPWWRALS